MHVAVTLWVDYSRHVSPSTGLFRLIAMPAHASPQLAVEVVRHLEADLRRCPPSASMWPDFRTASPAGDGCVRVARRRRVAAAAKPRMSCRRVNCPRFRVPKRLCPLVCQCQFSSHSGACWPRRHWLRIRRAGRCVYLVCGNGVYIVLNLDATYTTWPGVGPTKMVYRALVRALPTRRASPPIGLHSD